MRTIPPDFAFAGQHLSNLVFPGLRSKVWRQEIHKKYSHSFAVTGLKLFASPGPFILNCPVFRRHVQSLLKDTRSKNLDYFQAMEKQFETIRKTRAFLRSLVDNLTTEQLNEIPEGFSNNIVWNFGHIVAACRWTSAMGCLKDTNPVQNRKASQAKTNWTN